MLELLQNSLTDLGPYLGAAIYCCIGGFIPMLNTEIFVAFLGGFTSHSPTQFFFIVASAAFGRMIGTTILYNFAQYSTKAGSRYFKREKLSAKINKWHKKIEKLPRSRIYLMTLTGSTSGVPPLYIWTLALGALRITWTPHFFLGFVGSTIKYAAFFGLGDGLYEWFKSL